MARQITDGPATNFTPVTPSDTVAVNKDTRALYVGTGGNVAVVSEDALSTTITFMNVASGTILPIAPRRVMATGTTASNILALG